MMCKLTLEKHINLSRHIKIYPYPFLSNGQKTLSRTWFFESTALPITYFMNFHNVCSAIDQQPYRKKGNLSFPWKYRISSTHHTNPCSRKAVLLMLNFVDVEISPATWNTSWSSGRPFIFVYIYREDWGKSTYRNCLALLGLLLAATHPGKSRYCSSSGQCFSFCHNTT